MHDDTETDSQRDGRHLCQQNGGAMNELGELVNFRDHAALEQALDPLGRVLHITLQLDLEDGVREVRVLGGLDRHALIAAPAFCDCGGVPADVLAHHAQVRVQRDAHRGVERDLPTHVRVLTSACVCVHYIHGVCNVYPHA